MLIKEITPSYDVAIQLNASDAGIIQKTLSVSIRPDFEEIDLIDSTLELLRQYLNLNEIVKDIDHNDRFIKIPWFYEIAEIAESLSDALEAEMQIIKVLHYKKDRIILENFYLCDRAIDRYLRNLEK